MLNFFIWIVILYKTDLSIAMPVGSFSYIFVPVAAIIFLHERVSLLRWAGIAFIILGIHFVSQSRSGAKPGEGRT
jgi:undecaprenyl phosphate-alpha-L-ara4N flippase subunit ArnE